MCSVCMQEQEEPSSGSRVLSRTLQQPQDSFIIEVDLPGYMITVHRAKKTVSSASHLSVWSRIVSRHRYLWLYDQHASFSHSGFAGGHVPRIMLPIAHAA